MSAGSPWAGGDPVASRCAIPERFAAVFPLLPRFRQHLLPGLPPKRGQRPLMDDEQDAVLRADGHGALRRRASRGPALPIGWAIGQRDGFATFGQQVEMAKALTAAQARVRLRVEQRRPQRGNQAHRGGLQVLPAPTASTET